MQVPPLSILSSVLSQEEMDSLKKQTAKKEEEVEEKPPDPEFEVEHIVDYSLDKVTVSCACIAFKDV